MYILEILLDALLNCLAIAAISFVFILGAFLLGAILAIPSFLMRLFRTKGQVELSNRAKIFIAISYLLLTLIEIAVGISVPFSIDIYFPQAWISSSVVMSFGTFIIPFFVVTLAYVSNLFVLTTSAFADDGTVGRVIGRIVTIVLSAMLVGGTVAVLDCLATSMNWNLLLVALGALICGIALGNVIFDSPSESSLIIIKVISCVLCFAICGGLFALFVAINDSLMNWNEVACLFIAIAMLVATVSISRVVMRKVDGLKPKLVAYFRKKDANRVYSGRNTHQVNKITSKDEKFLETVACPNCGSKNIGYEIKSNKKKATVGQTVLVSAAGTLGGVFAGMAAGAAVDAINNSEDVEYICLDCGHKYTKE